jgi:hypothetical protein
MSPRQVCPQERRPAGALREVDFTLHIWASLAEQERKMISERTKAGLARSRKKLGMAGHSKAYQRRVGALGRAAMRRLAMQHSEAYRVYVEWALRHPGWRGRPISVQAAADKLNERNIPSPRGGRWWGETVMRMGQRLGLRHPLAAAHRRVPFKNRGAYWGMDLPVALYTADGARTLSGRVSRQRPAPTNNLRYLHPR